MNVSSLLAGDQGRPGLVWLTSEAPFRALRDHLDGMLRARAEVSSLRLTRIKFKPPRKLSAYYDVELGNAPSTIVRPIAVTWTSRSPSSSERRPNARRRVELAAIESGVAGPFTKLETTDSRWNMHVRVFPFDGEFPQLVPLSNPRRASGLAGSAEATVVPIRYRPEQRHVLCYKTPDESGGRRPVYVKLYASDRGVWALHAARLMSRSLEKSESLGGVNPLFYDRTHRALFVPEARGNPLSCLWSSSNVDDWTQGAGEMLNLIHCADLSPVSACRATDLASEAVAVWRAAAHIAALDASLGTRIRAILDRAVAAEKMFPPEAPRLIHGDFKADHIFVDDRRLTLIDFDSCRWSDPAADLGKFLSDMRWRDHCYGVSHYGRACELFLTGYQAREHAYRVRRARLWEAVLLAKAAARRVSVVAPDWDQVVDHMISGAESLLKALRAPKHRVPTEC
jgi:hypothetical protein